MKHLKITLLIFLLFPKIHLGQVSLITTNTSNDLLTISVFTNNIMVSGRDNYLVKSYNECNNLTIIAKPEPVNYSNYLYRIDTTIAYVLSVNQPQNSYKIYKTTDGCNTWDLKLDTSNFYLSHLRFFDSSNGIGVGSIYQYVLTNDGGNTWTSGPTPYPFIATTALEVYKDSLAVAGTVEGIAISKDKGKTWTGSNYNEQVCPMDFHFLNKDTIIGVAFQPLEPRFLKSTNGGMNWQSTLLPTVKDAYSVYFKNVNEGYVLGSSANGTGIILKTINFGQTWLAFDSQINTTLLDIKFLNDSTALVSGTNGVLFKWNSKTAIFTGIKSNELKNPSIKLWPNPVKDKLNIQVITAQIPELRLEIESIVGQVIYKEALFSSNLQIDLNFLAPGIYLVRLNAINVQGNVFKIVKN